MPNSNSSSSTANDEVKEELRSVAEPAANEFATPDKQEARAFLRERFLRIITGIVGKHQFIDISTFLAVMNCLFLILQSHIAMKTTTFLQIRTNNLKEIQIDKYYCR